MKKNVILIVLIVTSAIGFSAPKTKPTVFTIGDSTVQIWDPVNYPKTGWGQLLNFFFNSDSVTIVDKGVGGSSSASNYKNYWSELKSNIKAGDFVFIQFGINDGFAPIIDPSTSFKSYLINFVTETQALGAFPVLITPMNNNNLPNGSWGTYPDAVRQLATTLNIPLIDLDSSSKALFRSVGYNYTTNFIFMNLAPGDYITYPNGNVDNTHFQEMGAIEMAKLVVLGVKNLSSDVNVKTLIPYLNPTYKVTFNSNNSKLGTITRSEYLPAGINVTAKALPTTCAKFDGWSGDLIDKKAISSFIMGTTQKTIYANFSLTSAITEIENNSFNIFPNPVYDGELLQMASFMNSSKSGTIQFKNQFIRIYSKINGSLQSEFTICKYSRFNRE